VAGFLNFYPQYTLADLRGGGLSWQEFRFLRGGMLDVLEPESTESVEERVARKTRELAKRSMGGR
jgi:hypothetical protein